MLPPLQRARLEVVLVSPRNPLNIGAAARAMANFGLDRLAVVAPYEAHWREARSAVGAEALLAAARRTATLAEALAPCTLVAGTGTLTYRKPEQTVVPLPALTPLVQRELEQGGRVALVFGSEKHGLTRGDLAHCNLLVEIPTDPRQPSMNLGQAVAVCLYELSAHAISPDDPRAAPANIAPARASAAELERLASVADELMIAADYSPAAMRAANQHDLHLLLRRMALNSTDARRLLGLLRRVLWRLRKTP